jgi:DNA polymerase III subunit gamma/tau
LSRIIAKELGGTESTISELNISNMTGVDTAREIIRKARFAPFGGKKKIYILNECHKASNAFQNAMLEILEEPPKHCHFILCTTEPEKLLPTVRNRCTTYQVSPLRQKEIISLLQDICEKEEIEITDCMAQAIKQIAEACEGGPRQALIWLDAVIDIQDEEKLICTVQNFSVMEKNVLDLYSALKSKTPWKNIASILKSINDEPEKIRYAILTMANRELLKTGNMVFFDIINCFEKPFYHNSQLTAACFDMSLLYAKQKK